MSEQLNAAISEAWKAHRAGHQDDAIKRFNDVLSEDPKNLDALYGMGLAQRAVDDPLGAKATFSKLQKLLTELMEAEDGGRSRYQMTARMVKQQLSMLE